MKRLILSAILATVSVAHADPQLTSWFTSNSGQYARIYQSTAAESAGTKSATWSRGQGTQTNPAYAGLSEILYSAHWIYIRTTGLAGHVMGPWYSDAAKTQDFPNFPSNTAAIYRFPRVPVIPASKTLTPAGATGGMVNGVAIFDSRDTMSYSTAAGSDPQPGMLGQGAPAGPGQGPPAGPNQGPPPGPGQGPLGMPGQGDGIWNRDGYHNEGVTFDPALAHQAGNNYHYHAQPVALRHQLGDHVDYNPATNRYTESAMPVTQHSPIVGWAADGLPVYGPYGYSDPNDAGSGVRRMESGFVLRNGLYSTSDLTVAGRTTLPAWAARVQGRAAALPANQYGPDVNESYQLGHYIEDFDYLGDHGYTQGTDFDLNEQNVRFCKTPEFPSGTWAYFTTIKADGTPAYPYTTGRQYFGSPTGGGTTAAVMNADTPLTQYFIGGANTPLVAGTPNVTSPTVTLTWSSVEGGSYSVDASSVSDFSTFTNKAAGVVANGISTSSNYTTLASSGPEFGRVNRTALATYDASGQSVATVAQSVVAPYSAGTGSLSVTPSAGAAFTGGEGGPFTTPGATYTLQNTGLTSITWSAAKSVNWLNLDTTGGTLGAGATTTVTASANAAANTLAAGSYDDAVTFADAIGSTTRAVSLTILSRNADLAHVALSSGTLNPAFSSATTSYTTNVAKSALHFTVTPRVTQSDATVKVNGTGVSSGTASAQMPLNIGTNAITISVTAQDGVTTKTYALTVTRASRDPSKDLNGDGNTDFVFQNDFGQIAQWYMNGAGAATFAAYLYSGGLGDWKVKGMADMNGDGNTDLIFQNDFGQIAVWYLNGAGVTTSSAYLYRSGLGDWKVVGVADMNGDGNADLLFQNDAGQIVVWYMNGSGGITSGAYLYTPGLGDWRIAGAADLNNDGNADIVMQNDAGQIVIWYMDGNGVRNSGVYLSTAGLGDWRVIGVGDMNNDGNADLLFQNTVGQIVVWYLNGSGGITSGVFLYNAGLGDWRLR